MDRLASIVTSRTKAILICQPNNPTGGRMRSGELDELCRIAARTGAWVVSDEIYRGAEIEGDETASAWGRYDRTIVTSGLSKAYGLPGLRMVGTWRGRGRTLVSVRRGEPAVVVELTGHRYERLVIGSRDAAGIVEQLEVRA